MGGMNGRSAAKANRIYFPNMPPPARGIAPLLPAETPRSLIAMIMSLASLLSLGVALFLLKGKVPPPSSHETTEAYLRRDDVMARALLFHGPSYFATR